MTTSKGRVAAALVIGVASAALSGCAGDLNQLQAQSRVDPVTMGRYSTECDTKGSVYDTRTEAINLDCYRFSEVAKGQSPHAPETLAYSLATRFPEYRNRLSSILTTRSDVICDIEMGRYTANEATVNAGLSIASTGLSTAASIVSGELAKSILAGAAGFSGATRDHIAVNVYRDQIAPVVISAIWLERNRLKTDIRKNYSLGIAKWSIDDAIQSVNRYHGQCSFYNGLMMVLDAAKNKEALEAHRTSRAQQTRLGRLDQEIARLRAEARGLTGEAKQEVEKRLAELVLKRSKVGIDDGEEAVPPPDPVAPDPPTPEPQTPDPETPTPDTPAPQVPDPQRDPQTHKQVR